MGKSTATKSLHNIKPFKPTPLMLRWLHEGFRISSSSPTAISRSLGGRRKTYYDWTKIEGFSEWWDVQLSRFYTSQKIQLINIGMEKAEKDHVFWRDMMVYFGLMSQR